MNDTTQKVLVSVFGGIGTLMGFATLFLTIQAGHKLLLTIFCVVIGIGGVVVAWRSHPLRRLASIWSIIVLAVVIFILIILLSDLNAIERVQNPTIVALENTVAANENNKATLANNIVGLENTIEADAQVFVAQTNEPTHTPNATVTAAFIILTRDAEDAAATIIAATSEAMESITVDQPAPLSRQVIEQGSECNSDLNEGEIQFSTNQDPAPWQQCHYRIRPNRGIVAPADSDVSPLGYLQADISYSVPENPVLTGSASAYLEMVTFVDTIGLQIHCGLTDRWNEEQDSQERSAFISAALVGDPARLQCPEKIAGQANHDTDPSDARCELYWDTFGEPLNSDAFYTFKLEALQESHGVFVCSVDGEDYPDYSVNMQEIGWGGVDLLQLQFQRFVEVDVIDYRTTNFLVKNVRETP